MSLTERQFEEFCEVGHRLNDLVDRYKARANEVLIKKIEPSYMADVYLNIVAQLQPLCELTGEQFFYNDDEEEEEKKQ